MAPPQALGSNPMALPRGPEDGVQAGGFHCEAFGGDHVKEELLVKRTAGMFSIYRKPALIVRFYEGDLVTIAEGEWKEREP